MNPSNRIPYPGESSHSINQGKANGTGGPEFKNAGLNLFFLGFVSTSVQLLLMREVINISGGYELIAGTYLAAWLLNSAAGSFFAGRTGNIPVLRLNILLAVSPIISVSLMIGSVKLFFLPGETPSFFGSMIFTLVALMPVCFISGFSFIKMLDLAAHKGVLGRGKSFSIETVGGIAAGLAVSILSAGVLDTYQVLLSVIFLYALFLSCSFLPTGKRYKNFIILLWITLILAVLWFSPSIYIRQVMLPGIQVTGTYDSPYGNVTRGYYRGEYFIYYNHRLVRWAHDEVEREESIHFAMLQHRDPQKVLIIGGDPESVYAEVVKYNPGEIVFVERDPELLKHTAKEIPVAMNFRIEEDDAYRYVKKSNETFDVIVMNLPPPSSLQLNRYYTKEFMQQIHSRLDTSGVFIFSPGLFGNYYNDQSAYLYSVILNTGMAVFRHILPVGGSKLYFIASDSKLRTDICSLYRQSGVTNLFVNCDFMADDLIALKSKEILGTLTRETKLNSMANPVASFFYQAQNLSKVPGKVIPALLLLAIFVILPAATLSARNFPMYSAAASLAGFEILALMSIQTVMGNIYHLTGLVISVIMAGIAAGAGFGFFSWTKKPVRAIAVLMTGFYLAVYLLFDIMLSIDSGAVYAGVILAICFVPSVMTGSLFRILAEEAKERPDSSRVYISDLTGSALGFIVVSGLILPLAGVGITLLIFAGFSFTAFIFAMARNK